MVQTAFLTVVMGAVVGWIYASCLPDYYFGIYPCIPVYFYLLGWLTTGVVARASRSANKDGRKLIQAYLAIHVLRLLVSMVFMVIGCIAMTKEKAITFLWAFMLNYIVYLVYDSCFFVHRGEKKYGPKGKRI